MSWYPFRKASSARRREAEAKERSERLRRELDALQVRVPPCCLQPLALAVLLSGLVLSVVLLLLLLLLSLPSAEDNVNASYALITILSGAQGREPDQT